MKDELKLLFEKKPLKFMEYTKNRLNELKNQTYEFKKMQMADKLFTEMTVVNTTSDSVNESVEDLTKTEPHPLGYKGVKLTSYFTNHYKMLDDHYGKMEVVDLPPESYGIHEIDLDDTIEYSDDEIEELENMLSDDDFIEFEDEINESVIDSINLLSKNKKDSISVKLKSGQNIDVEYDDAIIINNKINSLTSKEKNDFIDMLSKDARSFMKALHLAKKK